MNETTAVGGIDLSTGAPEATGDFDDTGSAPDVLAMVSTLIASVTGGEFLLDAPISMETRFNQDLELESIEFVVLSEQLQQHYGERVDFVSWIGDMELAEIMSLTVGELVTYISTSLG